MDVQGLPIPDNQAVSAPQPPLPQIQIKVSYIDAANNTHTYQLDIGQTKNRLVLAELASDILAKAGLSKQDRATISVTRGEGTTQAQIRIIQGNTIRTLHRTTEITDQALEALKLAQDKPLPDKETKPPTSVSPRASAKHTDTVAQETIRKASKNSSIIELEENPDLPPPPAGHELHSTKPKDIPHPPPPPPEEMPPPPPEEEEVPPPAPEDIPPPPPEEDEEEPPAVRALHPPPPPPDEIEESGLPPPESLLDSVVNTEGTITTQYEGGGQQTVKEIATIASNRVFLQNMVDHLKQKYGNSPPPNIAKQIANYQQQLQVLDDPANKMLDQGWVHSNYTRDVLNQAASFEEGVQKYVSAPVNMRYVEASRLENSCAFVRVGVMSDMRNGWISLNALTPPDVSSPPPPPPLETAGDLASQEQIQDLISSLGVVVLEPALADVQGLQAAYSLLKSQNVNTPIEILVAMQKELEIALAENPSISIHSQVKEQLDSLLAPYYEPKTTPIASSREELIKENLEDAEDRIQPTLDRQFHSSAIQTKLQKLNVLLKELDIDPPTWTAENTVDELHDLLEKGIANRQSARAGVAAKNLIEEFFKTEKPFQSATYGLKQIQKAKQDPIALQDLVQERTQLLEQQMIQLLQTQILSDPDRVEKLLQQGKPLDLIHIGLLNPQKKELDASGWMHDEGVEMEDMRAIFQQFNGKTLVFDGTGPMIDGDKVHLPLKFSSSKGQNTIPLRAAVFNISPQGYVENTGLQKEANEAAIAILKDSKDARKALNEEGLFARLQAPEKNEKGYPIATELLQALLRVKGSLFISLGCLSAKDRTGLVADTAVIRSVVPQVKQQKAIDQINTPKSAAMQVAQKNTLGTLHSLKVNPFANLQMFSSTFGAVMQIAYNMALDWIIRRPKIQQLRSFASRTVRRFSQPARPPSTPLSTPSPQLRKTSTPQSTTTPKPKRRETT